jgi:hypothetical protein
MALLNQPVQVSGQFPKIFELLRSGQAPAKFNRQFLKDMGLKSSNHLQLIPLLKGLKFLTEDGSPTERYREFLDPTKWRKVLGEAVRDAYSDIFVLKAKPTNADRPMIAGKYRSSYNLSDNSADRSAATFLALLQLSDPETVHASPIAHKPSEPRPLSEEMTPSRKEPSAASTMDPLQSKVELHYDIQIHLPATKDLEVYNAIFKSLRSHLID